MAISKLTRLCNEWAILRGERAYRRALFGTAKEGSETEAEASARLNEIDDETRKVIRKIGQLTPASAYEALEVLWEFREHVQNQSSELVGIELTVADVERLSHALDGVAEWVRQQALAENRAKACAA